MGTLPANEPMSPIATYRERRWERECDFELYSDLVRASGKATLGNFETTITLSTLDPNFERLWVHGRLFYSGVFLFLTGLIILGVVVIGLNRETLDRFTGTVGLSTVFGFAMVLANRRKIELVRFRSDAGVPLLAIARTRNQTDKFDAFVSAIVERIVSSKAALRSG
jgi:hypothetical protein